MKKSKLAILALLLFAGLASFFAGCRKDCFTSADTKLVGPDMPEQIAGQSPGAFTREIVVKDASGQNSVVLEIAGDDESIVEGFDAGSFALEDLAQDDNAIAEDAGSAVAESASGNSAFEASDIHISIVKADLKPGVNGIQLVVKDRADGNSQRAAVDFWLHNSAFNYSKVWDYTTFYVEGYYCGTWPYWTKCCAGWRTNTFWVARGTCGNRSIHVTQATLPFYAALTN